jgi:hypothetical protein
MLVRAARRLFRRLATLIRRRRLAPSLGALVLPPELILMIVECLDTSSAVAVSLTCRSLYTLCFPHELRLRTAEKEELLLLLERDAAPLYYCHYCIKLHRWSPSWGTSRTSSVRDPVPCKRLLERSFVANPSTCFIHYHHARRMMNRNRYGPAHGLPLRKFESSVQYRSGLYGVMRQEAMHLRIVDDRLLVLVKRTFFHPDDDSRSLREYVDDSGRWICKHLTISRGSPSNRHAPLQLPELNVGENTSSHFVPCHTSFGSCPICLTDYDIEIHSDGKKGGLVVEVSAYCELGKCKSPFDWSWRVMADWKTEGMPRIARSQEHRLGIVRKRWNAAEGIDCQTHGKWVEITS